MVESGSSRLAREDWLRAALGLLEAGIDNVKIAPLAASMGVTTGSFYWHFRNRRELLDALLEYWEREMTDAAIVAAERFEGSSVDRILSVMQEITRGNLARYDLAIWHWAQSDAAAARAFRRVLRKRFDYAERMFLEAGFSAEQAQVRGRMMVVYMMGESTLVPGSMSRRKEAVALKHAILTASEG